MSDIDDTLRKLPLATKILENGAVLLSDKDIEQIKQAFADAGYMTPEQVAKTQELLNQMTNQVQDMFRGMQVMEAIKDAKKEAGLES